jgi:hypothetical protein
MEGAEQLVAAIGRLAAVELDRLRDDELVHQLDILQRSAHQLSALIAARLSRWDERRIWANDGSRSAAVAWAREGLISHPTAARQLRRARCLRQMPATTAALAAGRISDDHVDLLADAAADGRQLPFTDHESFLVAQASTLRYDQAKRVVAYWRHHADADLNPDGPPPDDRTNLADLRTGINGEAHLTAILDPVSGAELQAALRTISADLAGADRAAGGQVRTRRQLRAGALVEMARRALASPAGARQPRPLVSIICGMASFARLCELSDGTVINPGQLVAHLDRVDIHTIVFGDPVTPIAASGRRRFTGALRRAIEVRDRHCQHPSGCDEPIDFCDVDHITPWSHGGETSLSNGRLMCTYHNRVTALGTTPPALPAGEPNPPPPDTG